MTTPPPENTTYLDEAAALLRSALKSVEDRYRVSIGRSTAEDRRELLEARVRIAEAFARLHEADRAAPAGPQRSDQ